MKKILTFFILLAILVITNNNKNQIAATISKFLEEEKTTTILKNNEYSNKYNYNYIQLTNNFNPTNKQELLNIYYTIINSGMNKFTFYCNYDECLNDINYISKNKKLLSNINNFIHPYNTFKNIETTRYESTGKVIIKIEHKYTKEKIKKIEEKIATLINEKINEKMKNKEKIKTIHDYIINTTTYDQDKSDSNINRYSSDNAYGPLFEGYGVCNGYSDLMQIFLYKFNIQNIKVSSENHIWNLVNLDDKWFHLDLTWDDPIIENGKEIIDYSYFLITNEELEILEDDQHYYDKEIYIEAK